MASPLVTFSVKKQNITIRIWSHFYGVFVGHFCTSVEGVFGSHMGIDVAVTTSMEIRRATLPSVTTSYLNRDRLSKKEKICVQKEKLKHISLFSGIIDRILVSISVSIGLRERVVGHEEKMESQL